VSSQRERGKGGVHAAVVSLACLSLSSHGPAFAPLGRRTKWLHTLARAQLSSASSFEPVSSVQFWQPKDGEEGRQRG
jgi:hypothetical protein